jgi:hypothetical protein
MWPLFAAIVRKCALGNRLHVDATLDDCLTNAR